VSAVSDGELSQQLHLQNQPTEFGGPGALTILLLDDEAPVRNALSHPDLGAALRVQLSRSASEWLVPVGMSLLLKA